ncbi:MAG: chemotaxis protein CheB [Chroococcidiopsidaceae cyanobacterium CP_BM_ER_R8_30]|nr:chemotaxis protein CheB [Chroococcidiopsidaceae cyanobacterium CP_BM_ER_R8_30]
MKFELVVIGTSLGGLKAIEILLSGLPKGFPLAIAIAQHRHRNAKELLSKLLQQHSLLPVVEVEDKYPVTPGHVYLAPADYHLLVEPGNFALSTEAPVLYARPSIDLLFESASDAYTHRAIGVILTGANQDGSQGLAALKRRGGLAIVQDPNEAESSPMPIAAISATQVDHILPLGKIASCLIELANRGKRGR